jgi:electron transfer flavoprotein beta subunit
MAALDGLGSVVPTLVAAELGWPALTLASGLEIDAEARTATVTRELADADEVLTAPLPAVISVTDHANDPRMPDFRLIMAARRKPIEAWSLADIDVSSARTGQDGARTRVVEATVRPPRPEVEIVVDKGQGGQALADYLIRHELV